MIPRHRLDLLLHRKDAREAAAECSAFGYSEGWAICDGALVIYDLDDPPAWFRFERDDDGNSVKSCGCLSGRGCNNGPGCKKDESITKPCDCGPHICKTPYKPGCKQQESRKLWQTRGLPTMDEAKADDRPQTIKSAGTAKVNIDLTINGKQPDEYIKGLDSALSLLGRFASRR